MALAFRRSSIGGRLVSAAALFLLLRPSSASGQHPSPALTVHEEQGVYTVVARFFVNHPPSTALAVLTDYEHIPRFMPGVLTSSVLERAAGRTVVEQEAISSVLMFSKRIHLLLEIDEHSDALVFRDLCGRSFARYEGAWRVSPVNGGTAITYQLAAEPSFDVPGFMIRRLLQRDSTQMIDQLQREIAARAAAGQSPPPMRQE